MCMYKFLKFKLKHTKNWQETKLQPYILVHFYSFVFYFAFNFDKITLIMLKSNKKIIIKLFVLFWQTFTRLYNYPVDLMEVKYMLLVRSECAEDNGVLHFKIELEIEQKNILKDLPVIQCNMQWNKHATRYIAV